MGACLSSVAGNPGSDRSEFNETVLIAGWLRRYSDSDNIDFKDICNIIFIYYYIKQELKWQQNNLKVGTEIKESQDVTKSGKDAYRRTYGNDEVLTITTFSAGIHYFELFLYINTTLNEKYNSFNISFCSENGENHAITHKINTTGETVKIHADFDKGYFTVSNKLNSTNTVTKNIQNNVLNLTEYRLKINIGWYQGVEILSYFNKTAIITKMSTNPDPLTLINCAKCFNADKNYFYYKQAIARFGDEYKYEQALKKCYLFCFLHCCKKKEYDEAIEYVPKIEERMIKENKIGIQEIITNVIKIYKDRIGITPERVKYYYDTLMSDKSIQFIEKIVYKLFGKDVCDVIMEYYKAIKLTKEKLDNVSVGKQLFDLLPDTMIRKYKLATYAVQIVYADIMNIRMVLRYYKVQFNRCTSSASFDRCDFCGCTEMNVLFQCVQYMGDYWNPLFIFCDNCYKKRNEKEYLECFIKKGTKKYKPIHYKQQPKYSNYNSPGYNPRNSYWGF
eukprot:286549_1